jgi:hypothetical protein
MRRTHRIRTSLGRTAAVAAALLSVACGDARVRDLDTGISTDSMLAIIGAGASPGDSLANVYRHTSYFVQGKAIDVYFYDAQGRKFTEVKDVNVDDLVPIVVVDGKVEGWGWRHMDRVTVQYNIQARRDVMQ